MPKLILTIAFALVLAGCNRLAENSEISVTWRGISLEDAEFWYRGKPCGKGKEGFEEVLSSLARLPKGSRIVFRPYFPDYVYLIEKYSRIEEMPFVEDDVRRARFSDLLVERGFSTENDPVKSLQGLPRQK